MRTFISILVALLFAGQAEAGVKFKGGQISSSSGSLKTEKLLRDRFENLTLSDFDSSSQS